ncbi:MAG: DUF3450 family protein, partial [Porticoccaceae bacterium]|nr:DUF3450 family protein [Porticoccaceae bacterium]
MNKQPLKALALVAALIGGLTASAVQAAEVNDVLEAGAVKVKTAEVNDVLKAGAVKVKTAQTAQTKVDRIADQTDGLLQEFKQVNKQIESLRVYNSQLDRQIVSQKQMMAELQESIKNATVIERGISPLMASMLDGL